MGCKRGLTPGSDPRRCRSTAGPAASAASGTMPSSKPESPIPRLMQTSDTFRHKRTAIAVALTLAALARAAAHDGIDLDGLLDRVGEKIEQYFARAQRVVFLETTTIQYIGSNLSPEGFARVLESEVRVESAPAD